MSKLNLPLELTGERIEYNRLYDLTGTEGRNMTTTGVYSFTSLSSGYIYSTTTGGEYNVFLQLQTVLAPYGIVDSDFNPLVDHLLVEASDTVKGHVELATSTETTTGTDGTRAVTPLGLKSVTDLLIPLSQKGTAGGVSTLGTDQRLTPTQSPALIVAHGATTKSGIILPVITGTTGAYTITLVTVAIPITATTDYVELYLGGSNVIKVYRSINYALFFYGSTRVLVPTNLGYGSTAGPADQWAYEIISNLHISLPIFTPNNVGIADIYISESNLVIKVFNSTTVTLTNLSQAFEYIMRG